MTTNPGSRSEPEVQLKPSNDIEWKNASRIVMSGACMGTADLVPGVSGGTMAVALGIYRQLLAAIDSAPAAARAAFPPSKEGLQRAWSVLHWRFIASLGLGILIALVVMGKLVKLPLLVTTSPKPVYSVFFGLVLASCWILQRRMRAWSPLAGITLLGGAALGFAVVQLVPVDTPNSAPFLFLYGAIAITAMILPGISGAFMLLVMGQYEYIISSILALDLAVAVPFALGCAVGLMSFSKVLGWLLDRHHDVMTAALTGLLLGSLVRIWPYQEVTVEVIREKPRVMSAVAFLPQEFELSVVGLMLLGTALVFGIELLAARGPKTAGL